MTTPDLLDDIPLPTSYVLRANSSNPTWAMRVTTGNTTDVVRIPIPVGVCRVSVSWNGLGSITSYVGGVAVGVIASDSTAARRGLPLFEIANDDPAATMQLIGTGLTAADATLYTAGVTVYPISTIS